MTSLFTPAIRLMNRLKYPEKFLLVGIILVLPLSVVLTQYVAQANLVIDFAAREQLGLQYNLPLIAFLRDVEAHAAMIVAHSAGNEPFNAQIENEITKKQADIEADIAAINALYDSPDGIMTIDGAARWEAIKKEWETLKNSLSTLDTETTLALYGNVLRHMQTLINVVGNSTNQILDPDIDTYYLIDALINKIPANMMTLGGIVSYGTVAAAARNLSPSERTHLEIVTTQARTDLDAQRTTLDYIVGYNPALGVTLNPAFDDLTAKETTLVYLTDNDILNNTTGQSQITPISVDTYTYYERASQTIASTERFYHLLTSTADDLVQRRIAMKTAQRNGVMLLSIIALGAAIYLFAAFYLAVRGVINKLDVTSQQLVAGHMDEALVLENRDELAEVVLAFNTIVREMISARDQALAANRAMQESENRLRAILDALPLPITVVNRSGVLRYANPVAKSIFDLDVREDDPMTLSAFAIDPGDLAQIEQAVQTQGSVQGLEVRFSHASKVVRSGLVSIKPFQFSGEAALVASLVDITDLKESQERERKQRDLTEALLDSALILTSSLELDEVVAHILTNLQRVIAYDVANIMILEDEFAVVVGQQNNIDNDNYRVVGTRVPFREAYYPNLMFETRQPIILGDISSDPNFVRISQTLHLKAYVSIPIIAGQDVIGFINMASLQADCYSETHVKYLQIFALEASIAIQNAHLYEQASTIAALEERQKLARDLHDSVTQTLFSANTIAEALPQLIMVNHDKMHAYVQDLHQLTRGAMAEMRSLLVELRPEALTQAELGMLLSQLCDVFTGKTQIEIDRAITQKLRLQADIQIGFYRVAQEALNNIAKHAAASSVGVRLERVGDLVELSIRDNGAGFDPNLVPANHFGLRIMQERADAINASFIVNSEIKQGTQILLRRKLT